MGAGFGNRGTAGVELPEKDEVAERIARQYYEGDPALLQIYRILHPAQETDPAEPIKLLEVYRDAIPSGIILPIGFPPHPPSGMFYPTEVIQIAPEELEQVRNRQLPLPDGWVLGSRYDRPPDPGDVGP